MSRFSYQSSGRFNTYVLASAGPIALSPTSFIFYCTSVLLSAYTVLSQSLATVLSNSNPCFRIAKAHTMHSYRWRRVLLALSLRLKLHIHPAATTPLRSRSCFFARRKVPPSLQLSTFALQSPRQETADRYRWWIAGWHQICLSHSRLDACLDAPDLLHDLCHITFLVT